MKEERDEAKKNREGIHSFLTRPSPLGFLEHLKVGSRLRAKRMHHLARLSPYTKEGESAPTGSLVPRSRSEIEGRDCVKHINSLSEREGECYVRFALPLSLVPRYRGTSKPQRGTRELVTSPVFSASRGTSPVYLYIEGRAKFTE